MKENLFYPTKLKMKHIFRKQFEVDSKEINKQGHLNPVTLLDYFNDIAGDHSKSAGYPLDQLFKKGYAWVLLNWNICINHWPQSKDTVQAQTWISTIKRAFANREFILENQHNQILVRATSKWIFYNIIKKRPVRIRQDFAQQWPIENAQNLNTLQFKISPNQDADQQKTLDIQKKDIDILQHVHNSYYLQWILEMISNEISGNAILKQIQIDYHHELKYLGYFFFKQHTEYRYQDNEAIYYHNVWDLGNNRKASTLITRWMKRDK